MELQPVVFDASTLILLAKVDLLQIVAQKVEIRIPRVVESEAMAKPDLYDAHLIGRMIKEGAIRISESQSAWLHKSQSAWLHIFEIIHNEIIANPKGTPVVDNIENMEPGTVFDGARHGV